MLVSAEFYVSKFKEFFFYEFMVKFIWIVGWLERFDEIPSHILSKCVLELNFLGKVALYRSSWCQVICMLFVLLCD